MSSGVPSATGRSTFQDTKDCNSGKGLSDHIKMCLGTATHRQVLASGKKPHELKELLKDHARAKNKNIAHIFDNMRKAGIHTYLNIEHTPQQTQGFLELMKCGRPHYWVPHPTTVLRDMKKALACTRQCILTILREYQGDINFAAITAHIITERQREKFLLDFFEVAEVLCITGHNMVNNNKMIEELGWVLPHFPGKEHQICCFAHTVNLIAKSFLPLFENNPGNSESDEAQLLKTLEEFERGEDVELDKDDLATVKEEAAKLREELREKAEQQVGVVKDNIDGLLNAHDDLPLEDEEALKQEVAPFCAVLMKVCGTLACPQTGTDTLLDPWPCLQDYTLQHNPSTCLEKTPLQPQPNTPTHSVRCQDPMEFYI
ncbi:hypothetical protein AAF712_014479 [Marasmius tenuissimus]|uniref:Transposase n=1 Tax=Marasmius tenuissimus TaxID=585030 RepID=A0ABR2ZC16_9AGAR